MNKEVLKQHMENLTKELDKCKRALEDGEDFILCPKQFEKIGPRKLGLRFDNDRVLFCSSSDKIKVCAFDEFHSVKTKIRRKYTPLDELQVGTWYYRGADFFDHALETQRYYLYLGNGKAYKINNNEDLFKLDTHISENYHEVVIDEE